MNPYYQTEEMKKSFEEAAKPLIEWLATKSNPHTTVVVSCTDANFDDGELVFKTEEFLID